MLLLSSCILLTFCVEHDCLFGITKAMYFQNLFKSFYKVLIVL